MSILVDVVLSVFNYAKKQHSRAVKPNAEEKLVK